MNETPKWAFLKRCLQNVYFVTRFHFLVISVTYSWFCTTEMNFDAYQPEKLRACEELCISKRPPEALAYAQLLAGP